MIPGHTQIEIGAILGEFFLVRMMAQAVLLF
jgi:hypothetical protein